MAGDTIGKLSLKIDGDATGLSRAVNQSKSEIAGLTSGGGVGGFLQANLGKFLTAAAVIEGFRRLHENLREAADHMKSLQLAAERTGTSFEWIQRIGHYAEKANMDIESVVGALSKFRLSAGERFTGEMSLERAYEILKVTPADMMKGPEKFYEEMAKRIMALDNIYQRTQVAKVIGGKAGPQFEPIFRMIAKGEEEPLTSRKAREALLDYKETWREAKEEMEKWKNETLGWIAGGLGFGKSVSQRLIDEANEGNRRREEIAGFQRSMVKRARELEAEFSKRLLTQITGGGTPDDMERERLIRAQRDANLPIELRTIDALIAQRKEATALREQKEEIRKQVERTVTAEEKFIEAVRKSRSAWMAGFVNEGERDRLIEQAKKDLGSSWKSQTPQLGELALRGSQEAYRAIVGAQNQDREFQTRMQEINRLMLVALQATERNTRMIATPPTTAHFN